MSTAPTVEINRELLLSPLGGLLIPKLTRVVPVPSPGNGLDPSVIVPGGEDWDIVSMIATLVTDATAVNRSPRLRIVDGDSNILFTTSGFASQGASGSNRFCWAAGLGSANTGVDIHIPLPINPFIAKAGWSVKIVTNALQAGDVYSPIFLVVRDLSAGQLLQAYYEILREIDSANF